MSCPLTREMQAQRRWVDVNCGPHNRYSDEEFSFSFGPVSLHGLN